MLPWATLETAEKEKWIRERKKNEKPTQTEHTNARLPPWKIGPQMEIDEIKNAAEVLSNQKRKKKGRE